MSFKQLIPKKIKTLSPLLKCNNVECDTIVVSAVKMFNKLFHRCVSEQMEIFGLSGDEQGKKIIYLNNFCIMIDSVFRITYLFGEHYNYLMKKFKAKNFILIDDLDENRIDDICPRKWWMYDENYKKYCSEDYVLKWMLWKLKSLCSYLDSDEIEDYDCWETLLAGKFPELYDFCLRNHRFVLENKYERKRREEGFLYYLAMSQIQLNKNEIFACWSFVMRQIKKSKINVLSCENGGFDYNIVHLFMNKRTVFVCSDYVNVDNIYFYDYYGVYYPCGAKSKIVLKDFPNENAKLVKRMKFKKKLKNMIDLFDVCEKECFGKIMDVNSAYSLNVFSNMRMLYVSRKFNELMPDKIEESEYSWITKDSYEECMNEWIKSFNKISKLVKIRIEDLR